MTPDRRRAPTGNERRRLILLFLTVVGLTVLTAYWLSSVFGPLLLGLVLAYVLDPIVQLCERRVGLRRAFAAPLVLLLFLLSSGGVLWFLVDQGIALYDYAFATPGLLRNLPQEFADFARELPTWVPGKEEVLAWLNAIQGRETLSTAVATLQDAIEALGNALGTLFTLLSLVVLLPIYLYYFLQDLPAIFAWFRAHIPASHRERVLSTAGRIHVGLAAFLRGRIVIAVLKGSLLALGLYFIDLPFAFAVGMITGMLSIIPIVGSALGLIVAILLALQMGVGTVTWVLVIFGVAELIEGYLLYPLILAGRLAMHPVTMLFSFLAWGSILGIFGVLVAIPLTIIARAITDEFVLRPLERLAIDDGPSDAHAA